MKKIFLLIFGVILGISLFFSFFEISLAEDCGCSYLNPCKRLWCESCDWGGNCFYYTDDSCVGGSLPCTTSCQYGTCQVSSCNCTSWRNVGCGYGTCLANYMYQTRDCTPYGCDTQTQCVYDSSCKPACSCGSWIDSGCGQGGCSSSQMYQTRSCSPYGCEAQSQCVYDSSCQSQSSSCRGGYGGDWCQTGWSCEGTVISNPSDSNLFPGRICCVGECKSSCSLICNDSDGGKNWDVQGSCSDGSNCSVLTNRGTDSCSGKTLTEWYCEGSFCKSTTHTCSGACSNGACSSGPSYPDAPNLISPSNGATGVSTSVSFSWSSVIASGGWYHLYYKKSSDTAFTAVSSLSSNQYTLSSLQSGNTYLWEVRACNTGALCTDSTSTFSFTTAGTACPSNQTKPHKECVGTTCQSVDSCGADTCTDNSQCVTPAERKCKDLGGECCSSGDVCLDIIPGSSDCPDKCCSSNENCYSDIGNAHCYAYCKSLAGKNYVGGKCYLPFLVPAASCGGDYCSANKMTKYTSEGFDIRCGLGTCVCVTCEDDEKCGTPSPLTISGVKVDPSQTSATFTWTTNKPAIGQVGVCLPGVICFPPTSEPSLTESHSVVIGDLTTGETYHYTINSLDKDGNKASPHEGEFTAGSSIPPPEKKCREDLGGICCSGDQTCNSPVAGASDCPDKCCASADKCSGGSPNDQCITYCKSISYPSGGQCSILTPDLFGTCNASPCLQGQKRTYDYFSGSGICPFLNGCWCVKCKDDTSCGVPSVLTISGVNVISSQTGATFTWTTNKKSSSNVKVGYSLSTPDTDNTTHSAVITGLTPGTAYNYTIEAVVITTKEIATPYNGNFTTLSGGGKSCSQTDDINGKKGAWCAKGWTCDGQVVENPSDKNSYPDQICCLGICNQPGACIDSDNGKNMGEAGDCFENGVKKYSDLCAGQWLKEAYCENNKCKTTDFDCGKNEESGVPNCKAGACINIGSTCNNNGKVESPEQCDGTDLNGKTCRDLGYKPGTGLKCKSDCTFDTSACIPCTVQQPTSDLTVGGSPIEWKWNPNLLYYNSCCVGLSSGVCEGCGNGYCQGGWEASWSGKVLSGFPSMALKAVPYSMAGFPTLTKNNPTQTKTVLDQWQELSYVNARTRYRVKWGGDNPQLTAILAALNKGEIGGGCSACKYLDELAEDEPDKYVDLKLVMETYHDLVIHRALVDCILKWDGTGNVGCPPYSYGTLGYLLRGQCAPSGECSWP